MTSIHFVTQGCTANHSDTEQMAGLLQEARFEIIDNLEDADVVIFNTCTVKNPSESAFFTSLEKIKLQYPYKTIIVTGCIPQADPLNPKLQDFCLVGTRQIHKIVEIVEEALNDNIVRALETGEIPPLNLPRVRKNPVVGVIPINLGCLGACTFCKTKSARFTLKSYPISEIKQEVIRAVKDGCKEIWLTSQDTFCYGFDIGTNIAQLLSELVTVPGDFRIRVGMGNPDHMPRIKEELIAAYKYPKVFKFLHLPLQAGNNQVLEEMRRRYTVAEFLQTIADFKQAIPEINIMTDVIVGYPTETEEQYHGTLDVIKQTMPDSVNISRFWPRPGTKASELPELPGDIVKHRSGVLTDIFHNISRMQNERWLGWQGRVIIDEQGKQAGQWIGRNDSYKPIIVTGDFRLGDFVSVRITKATTFGLMGSTQST